MKTPDVNSAVGHQLRLRRTMLGLTQDALARGIGVAAQQVQKYECGTNVMNVNRLQQFAQFLNVPVGYFFEGVAKSASPRTADDADAPMAEHASDRESIEIVKSFKRIQDPAVRKRVADLLRTLSFKDI